MKNKLMLGLLAVFLVMLFFNFTSIKTSSAQDSNSSCFLSGTLIKTPAGPVTIESLKSGDRVTSEFGGMSLVGDLVSKSAPGFYSINTDLLKVTGTHPIYVRKPDGRVGWGSVEVVPKEAWAPAGENLRLQEGDSLLGYKVGWIPIYSVKFISGNIEVFNLKNVDPDSTFYANGVLVHNKGSGNEGSGGVSSDGNDPGACGNGDGSNYLPPGSNGFIDWSNPNPNGPIDIEIFIPVPCEGPGCYTGFTPIVEGGGGGGGGGSGGSCTANAGAICQSLPNACNLTSAGRVACSGVCVAVPPPDSQCPAPGAAFGQSSSSSGDTRLINSGSPCTITWSATNAGSCSLTGPGVSASGISGSATTPPLTRTTVYTLTCRNGAQTVSKNFTCRINPNFNEF